MVVSVKAISRWIKTSSKEACIDTNIFQECSSSSSSSSKAKLNGANITQILNASGWSKKKHLENSMVVIYQRGSCSRFHNRVNFFSYGKIFVYGFRKNYTLVFIYDFPTHLKRTYFYFFLLNLML